MRLLGFRVKNIKSIIDTEWCHLSDVDNITVFAGQNEAGKSAILEGLNFFRNGSTPQFEKLSKRLGTHPYVECEFELEDIDRQGDLDVLSILTRLTSIKLYRGNTGEDDYTEVGIATESLEIINAEIDKIIEADEVKQKKDKSIQSNETSPDGDQVTHDSSEEPPLDAEGFKKTILQHFLNHLPQFIYYDSFLNILPGTVQLSEIGNYPAIQDLQKVFGINFSEIVKADPRARGAAEFTLNKNVTVDLNSYWKQQQTTKEDDHYVYDIKIHPNSDINLSIIEFLIHRNDGVSLYLEQKSKGFQWFSSFNLRLKALGVDLQKSERYVVLIDEPGQGLHEKAQADVKAVLQELADKGMQIIYTTHNPSLIGVRDHEILRIRLVYQTPKEGTKAKNIAQFSSSDVGSKDALSPIITAMGINSVGQLLDRNTRCVVLEGITDHYYFNALKILLGITDNYAFIPAVGVHNIKPLLSVLLGWGTDFKAVFDDGEGKRVYRDIAKYLYPNDATLLEQKILKLDGFDGIEDLFSKDDFDSFVIGTPRKDKSMKNSEIAKTLKKELLGRLFLEKVQKDADKMKLSPETRKNFTSVFDWLRS